MRMTSFAYVLARNCSAAYTTHKEGSYTPSYLYDNIVAVVIRVALCGTSAGQPFSCWLGDKMGRKRAYGMTLILVVVCSITSGFSFNKDPKAVMSTVCFFHFWLGFGIEGFGIFAGGMVGIITSAAFNAKFLALIYGLIAFDQLCLKLITFGGVEKSLTRASHSSCVTVYIHLVTAVVIDAMGFCTDAYDLFCILAVVIRVALCGTSAGQPFSCWLGDKMGRKRAYGMTLILVVVCSITSGLSFNKDPKAVMSTVCFFHFWLGFGIEGFGIFAGGMGVEKSLTRASHSSCVTVYIHLVTAVVIDAMGFCTDAYLYDNIVAVVIRVALCGTSAGQPFSCWLGDKMGRKRAYGMTLILVVVCSITSGLSFNKDPKAVMSTVCFFHFWLGFGIEGDYPLFIIIMFCNANKKTRGAFIDVISAMQGFGIFAGGMVGIITSAAFNAKFLALIYGLIAFDQLCLKLITFGV
ncbi:hypothetical protein JRO89_XS03G0040400 [Xanthoceras sorbifolium]|uniref:Major facilitator superfamily (MFS) profile domain-containing protein n=1 Tax=Xanthoceras sorbifolium TaxID=99658 RepID=A0ABQ8I8I7_9ROSI|nr:hypothetical protein JRO89_XS03G0040400 [Xanthoceras sorbifolium]